MKDLGVSNVTAGSVYAIAGIVSVGGARFWGMLADRMGVRKALLLSVVGDLLPIMFPHSTNPMEFSRDEIRRYESSNSSLYS